MQLIDYIKGHRDSLSPVQEILDPSLSDSGIRLLMKRDDLIHPVITGNKWRKLRYNLHAAVLNDHHTLLTFGGAFSNHIAATAQACFNAGLESIGVIRGQELGQGELNPTLSRVRELGMQLHFVTREEYGKRNDPAFITALEQRFGRFHLVPEGGANAFGVKGCAEILPEVDEDYDVVCCAAGTGTTLAGLRLSMAEGKRLIGFPALKGGAFLSDEVNRLSSEARLRPVCNHIVLELQLNHHFGGYAKMTPELREFIMGFHQRTGVLLDPVYTGKMMFGIYDLIRQGYFQKDTTLLAVHTGGVQGWDGMKDSLNDRDKRDG